MKQLSIKHTNLLEVSELPTPLPTSSPSIPMQLREANYRNAEMFLNDLDLQIEVPDLQCKKQMSNELFKMISAHHSDGSNSTTSSLKDQQCSAPDSQNLQQRRSLASRRLVSLSVSVSVE